VSSRKRRVGSLHPLQGASCVEKQKKKKGAKKKSRLKDRKGRVEKEEKVDANSESVAKKSNYINRGRWRQAK